MATVVRGSGSTPSQQERRMMQREASNMASAGRVGGGALGGGGAGGGGEAAIEMEDGRTYNPKAVSFIREKWLLRQMREKEDQFTESVNLKVFCGTWNVNGKKLGSGSGKKGSKHAAVSQQQSSVPSSGGANAGVGADGSAANTQSGAVARVAASSATPGAGTSHATTAATLAATGFAPTGFTSTQSTPAGGAGRHGASPNVVPGSAMSSPGPDAAQAADSTGAAGGGGGGSLADWLFHDNERDVDLFVVGFQEIVDLNAVNVAVDSKTVQRSAMWDERIRACLQGGKYEYERVAVKYLVGILLCVYAKKTLIPHIRDVMGVTVGVGVMGVMGNKGAASVRLQIYDSTLCFVCSHLAAHRDNVGGRNADFATISEKVAFQIEDNASGIPGAPPNAAGGGAAGAGGGAGGDGQGQPGGASSSPYDDPEFEGLHITDHDFVFWLGDLNYRIEESISTEEVFYKVEEEDWSFLRARDQLVLERAKNAVFQGYAEGPLEFPCSYKFQPGTDFYEKRPEKKLRAPAWCDRVLWTAKDMRRVQQRSYFMAGLNISDHKPVGSLLEMQAKTIVLERQRDVYHELLRMLDRWENESNKPKVDISTREVDFGELRYMADEGREITLKNTGTVVAHFRFVPKPDESGLSKPWITIYPTFGMLLPEESTTITISALVDNPVAHSLNMGQDTLDDILVLRLENGCDFFVSLNAVYARSCFGCSLSDLVAHTEPMRGVPLPGHVVDAYDTSGAGSSGRGTGSGGGSGGGAPNTPGGHSLLSVPKELWRMIDALYQSGMREKDLFILPGSVDEVQMIRECLDCGIEFGAFSPFSMAEAATTFLSSLTTPIIPEDLWPTVEIDAHTIQQWSRRFLERLPPLHYNVFVYVVSFFREVLQHSSHNKLTPAKLALVCCNSFMRLPQTRHRGASMSMAPSAAAAISTGAAAGGAGAASGASGEGGSGADGGGGNEVGLNGNFVTAEEARNAQRIHSMQTVISYLLTTPAI